MVSAKSVCYPHHCVTNFRPELIAPTHFLANLAFFNKSHYCFLRRGQVTTASTFWNAWELLKFSVWREILRVRMRICVGAVYYNLMKFKNQNIIKFEIEFH